MISKDKIELVSKQLKQRIAKKYTILEIKLFGSSVRGDFSKGSDIDIMVKLPNVTRRIEEDVFDISYDLELEHDCQIDIIVFSEDIGKNIPLYQNIKKEGIAI